MGLLFPSEKRWDQRGLDAPDGNYLITRWDEHHVEVLSDASASRTGWYAFTDSSLFVSSSMRVLVALLGNLELDDEAVSWVLGTGCLGPDRAWDRRIKMLPPDTILRLDRKSWTLSIDTKPISFSAAKTCRKEDLRQAIKQTLASITPVAHRELSLSGGVDSRGLLMMMPEAQRPSTFSIKAASELRTLQDDVAIAARVADASKTRHELVEFDDLNTPLSVAMDRFFRLAEGRVDHFSAAAGGWTQWKALHEKGTSSILRGDEGFGWSHALSEEQVQTEIGVSGLHRHFTEEQITNFGLKRYSLPPRLTREEEESLEDWRDRLYHQHRLPVILSALTEAKAGYVDVINPFLSRHILKTVRAMASRDRTEKAAFRELVAELLPSVPYATKAAHRSVSAIMGSDEFKAIATKALRSRPANEIFSQELREYALGRLNAGPKRGSRPTLGRIARRLFPAKIVTRLRAAKHSGIRPIEPGTLAFRMVMIAEMVRMLEEDATLLKGQYGR